jgi:hypothetical protein
MRRSRLIEKDPSGRAPERSRRARRRLSRHAAGLAAACAPVLLAGIAIAAPHSSGLSAPTITRHPAALTRQGSARFAYSYPAATKFQCKLDRGAFRACAKGGTTYAGPLGDGRHTFAVRAITSHGTSATRTTSWTVDRTAPTTALAYPASGATLSAGTWGQGCTSRAGLCGTAQDTNGVRSVLVSISSPSGRWWDGSSFKAGSETFLAAKLGAGSSKGSWSYAFALPSAGAYTVHIRATDLAGNATAPSRQTVGSFTIATSPPSSGGQAPPGGGSTGGSTVTETPPATTTVEGKAFTVSGGTSAALAPGLTRALSLTIANPNDVAISVTALTVTVATGSSKAGCDGPTNLLVTQSNLSASDPLNVPAHGQASLPSGSLEAPAVLMKNLPTNQDACKNASFTFDYSGSAHS